MTADVYSRHKPAACNAMVAESVALKGWDHTLLLIARYSGIPSLCPTVLREAGHESHEKPATRCLSTAALSRNVFQHPGAGAGQPVHDSRGSSQARRAARAVYA